LSEVKKQPNGTFISTAKVENNNLILRASKMHKAKYFELNQWPRLLEVLDAAYTYSQSKIVLKKQ
jgi:hypothetical protein